MVTIASRSRSVAVLGIIVVSAIVVAAAKVVASAQSQPVAGADPLPQLLSEVHSLRIAIEQQASIGPRIQLALARLTIEEQRISHLSSQLDSIREQLSNFAAGGSGGMKERLADVEKNLTIEVDPAKRLALESEQRMIKYQISAMAAMEQRLRDRENDLSQALASEQARWNELSSRLDDLERLLTPVR